MIFLYRNTICSQGRKRNPNDWSYDMSYKSTMTLPDLTDRGYTGHEHLEDYQLINMNGRIYDPITHQLTGPDILDVNPYSTQAYNRYAYVMNNPMKYTDPSGYKIEIKKIRNFFKSFSFGMADGVTPETTLYLLNLIATPRMLSSSIINNPL